MNDVDETIDRTDLDRTGTPESGTVVCVRDVSIRRVYELLHRFALCVMPIAPGDDIPGSYWGECEAGLIGNCIYVRDDTPVHSVLHEAAHFICMDAERRHALHTDAGGDYDEENAVCYLQILLADHIDGLGRERMLVDMDRWGYTFRLGSARAWFEQEAQDTRQWLIENEILDASGRMTWRRKR